MQEAIRCEEEQVRANMERCKTEFLGTMAELHASMVTQDDKYEASLNARIEMLDRSIAAQEWWDGLSLLARLSHVVKSHLRQQRKP